MNAADLKTLAKLAAVGAGECFERLRRGELGARFAWTAVRGSERCLRAIVSGDVTDEATAQARVGEGCLRCPKRVERPKASGHRVIWCGQPGVEDRARGTCGCFVALEHPDGTVTPECAARQASKECWSGNWGRAPRVELTVSA